MSAAVKDAIAASIGELERAVAVPSPPFGYGSDLSCDTDLREDMAEVDGFETLSLAQALARRLDCPRGGLADDPDYGIDLRSYCNRGHTTAEIRALSGAIRNELTKDDRISGVGVTVRPTPTGSRLGIEIAVDPVDPRLGPFRLTLAVTSAEVLLEEIR